MGDLGKAVFLSYASQDAEAARRICEALRAAGVEVWFDTDGGLEHGDEWDAKIRRQIKECVLFIPIISANTQAREEGYFRLEWDLAAERARTIASGVAFILPVVIDDTKEPAALVPDRFRAVQWTKLPGGSVPPEVLQRFLKLWSHRTGLLKEQAAGGRQQADDRTQNPEPGTLNRAQRPRWLAPVIAGGVIALLALVFTRPWEKAAPLPFEPSARRSAPTTAETSEAKQLVAKAWEQMNKPELARPELEIADELCKRAVALEPNEAAVWAAWSQVDAWYLYHNFDSSPSRREGARTKAARAIQLAPASYEARLAQACQLIRCEGNDNPTLFAAEADRMLRALLQEQPGEPRALLALGILLRNTDRMDEVRVVFGHLAKNPAFATQAWNELGWAEYLHGNFRAAGPPTEASISLQPYWGNLMLQTLLAMRWTGDLDLAKDSMERIPAAIRQEDNGISQSSAVYYWRREPDNELRVLNSVARDWLRSNASDGPKATLAGEALLLAGRREAAEVQFRAALKLVEQHLAEQSGNGNLLRQQGQLLALLGDRTGAEKALRLARDMGNRNSTLGEAADQVLLGNLDATVTLLEKAVDERSRGATAAMYRLNPMWDPLREQPRFKALLARMEADPRFSPTAKPVPAPSSLLTSPSRLPEADAKSVAVLAFANLSDDKGNEYFSDGISEELLNVLAKVPGLKVTARTSSFHFKGMNTAIPEIASQLGVAYVVEGSVRKQGDKVRITAQLIKAADGFHVWSDTFTRDLKDIFAVQDEIAGLIAGQLSLQLGTGSRAATAMVKPEVFELYVRARQAWNLRTLAGYDHAEQLLNQALAMAPDFARAHAALADVWIMRTQELTTVGAFDQRNSPELSRQFAKVHQALDLDPDLAEAHATLGSVWGSAWNDAESERALRRAIALNPSYASAHQWLGRTLERQGRMDEALVELKLATELDPLSSRILDNYAAVLFIAGRLSASLAAADRALALQPESTSANFVKARTLVALGRVGEAIGLMERLPDSTSLDRVRRIILLGRAGREAEAMALLAAGDLRVQRYRAWLLLQSGRREEGLATLDVATIPFLMIGIWLCDPLLDPVRKDPRFVKFIADLGLTEAHARAQAWRKANPPEAVEGK